MTPAILFHESDEFFCTSHFLQRSSIEKRFHKTEVRLPPQILPEILLKGTISSLSFVCRGLETPSAAGRFQKGNFQPQKMCGAGFALWGILGPLRSRDSRGEQSWGTRAAKRGPMALLQLSAGRGPSDGEFGIPRAPSAAPGHPFGGAALPYLLPARRSHVSLCAPGHKVQKPQRRCISCVCCRFSPGDSATGLYLSPII